MNRKDSTPASSRTRVLDNCETPLWVRHKENGPPQLPTFSIDAGRLWRESYLSDIHSNHGWSKSIYFFVLAMVFRRMIILIFLLEKEKERERKQNRRWMNNTRSHKACVNSILGRLPTAGRGFFLAMVGGAGPAQLWKNFKTKQKGHSIDDGESVSKFLDSHIIFGLLISRIFLFWFIYM